MIEGTALVSPLAAGNPSLLGHLLLKQRLHSVDPATESLSQSDIINGFPCELAQDRVRHSLKRMGFSISRKAPFNIIVRAPRHLWEEVFKARVEEIWPPSRSLNELSSQSASYWKWIDTPVIPAELADAIDAVVLPSPVEFFS